MKNFKEMQSFINDKNVYVGIDVHKEHWVVCSVCDGEVVEKQKLQAKYTYLKYFLSRYKQAHHIQIVYEAGFSGFWLYRQLTKERYHCIVTPPSLTPQNAGKVKTDKRDAQKLAFYLSAGLLKGVWVPPAKVESDRRVLRGRVQIVKKVTRAKHQIRAFLNLFGIKRPESIKTNWCKKYLEWLESLKYEHESDQYQFRQLLKDYYHQREQLIDANLFLRQLSKSENYHKNFQLLTSAPGIGLISGMTVLLEIYDFNRFKNGDQFASYLGLTPSQYSSGEHVRLGHITRQGNTYVRRILVECAWSAIRRDPHLAEKYDRIRTNGANGKKAIVAVARSFAIRLRAGLLSGTGYVIGVC